MSALLPEEAAAVQAINTYRQQQGAGPLQVSLALRNSSSWMANDMATNNYLGHTDKQGRDPFQRMDAFGYTYPTRGENVAAGDSTGQGAFQQWLNACDPDTSGNCTYLHRTIMSDPNYKVIGISRGYNPSSQYQYYWAADFGGTVDTLLPTAGPSAPTPAPAQPAPTPAPQGPSLLAPPAPAPGPTPTVIQGQPAPAPAPITPAQPIYRQTPPQTIAPTPAPITPAQPVYRQTAPQTVAPTPVQPTNRQMPSRSIASPGTGQPNYQGITPYRPGTPTGQAALRLPGQYPTQQTQQQQYPYSAYQQYPQQYIPGVSRLEEFPTSCMQEVPNQQQSNTWIWVILILLLLVGLGIWVYKRNQV